MEYVQVAEAEGKESIDIPSEDDGTLLLSTITNLFPDAVGLKYIVNKRSRVLRLANEKLYPPPGGWGDNLYLCILKDLKRQRDDDSSGTNSSSAKRAKEADGDDQDLQNRDLIVKELGYTTTDKNLLDYFSTFGEVKYAKRVLDNVSGQSKGYAFVRFTDDEISKKVLSMKHRIGGRAVIIERSVNKIVAECSNGRRIFVGNLNDDITREMLVNYFEKFGKVVQVYIPTGSKGYAFVTFEEEESGLSALKYPEHKINHHKIRVGEAHISKKPGDNNIPPRNPPAAAQHAYPTPPQAAANNFYSPHLTNPMYQSMYMAAYNAPYAAMSGPGMWANPMQTSSKEHEDRSEIDPQILEEAVRMAVDELLAKKRAKREAKTKDEADDGVSTTS